MFIFLEVGVFVSDIFTRFSDFFSDICAILRKVRRGIKRLNMISDLRLISLQVVFKKFYFV